MALLKAGALITDIRGSIEGMTFSKGPGGLQAKKKPKPSRRVRTTQPVNRAILGYLARVWGTLTAAQRTAWENWALVHPGLDKFGDEFIMSGLNAFIMLNHPANRLGFTTTYNADPPTANLDKGMASLVASDGASDGVITLTWTHNGVGLAADKNELSIAGPFTGPGRQEVTNYSYHKSVDGNLLTVDTDSLIVDAWYHLRVRYVQSDGQASAWLYDHYQAPDVV